MDIIKGQKFNRLTISGNTKKAKKHKLYECTCECGNIRFHTKQNLLKGTLISCGCFKSTSNGQKHKNWKGIGKISASFFDRIKECAKRRRIPFNIDLKYISKLFDNQKEKCIISGINLTAPASHKESRAFKYNASLDRINSDIGYLEGNVQWVDKDVNMMKQQYTLEYFIKICIIIANNQKENKCTF